MKHERIFRGYAVPLSAAAGQAFGGILLRLMAIAFMCWEYVAVWFLLAAIVAVLCLGLGLPFEVLLIGMAFSALGVVFLQEVDRWMRLFALLALTLFALLAVPLVGLAWTQHLHEASYQRLSMTPFPLEIVLYGTGGVLLLLVGFFSLVKLSWWFVFRDSPPFPYHMPRGGSHG